MSGNDQWQKRTLSDTKQLQVSKLNELRQKKLLQQSLLERKKSDAAAELPHTSMEQELCDWDSPEKPTKDKSENSSSLCDWDSPGNIEPSDKASPSSPKLQRLKKLGKKASSKALNHVTARNSDEGSSSSHPDPVADEADSVLDGFSKLSLNQKGGGRVEAIDSSSRKQVPFMKEDKRITTVSKSLSSEHERGGNRRDSNDSPSTSEHPDLIFPALHQGPEFQLIGAVSKILYAHQVSLMHNLSLGSTLLRLWVRLEPQTRCARL